MTHKIALLGFGVVGQGLAEILQDKSESLRSGFNFDPKIVAISDVMKGSLYDPKGLDLSLALQAVKEIGKLDSYPETPSLVRGWDSFQTIRESNADTVVEITFTDVKTGQPAIDHCKAAFESKKNVVMSNKGPVSLAYQELAELAKKNDVRWGFEGTVMSGTPALRMPLSSLAGNSIFEIRGILNGTTNYILTKMEEGLSYQDALSEAQALGYAEADPTSDVEGYDAQYKATILANIVMGIPMKREEVECEGISHLTEKDIEWAKSEGKRWKLIAKCIKAGDKAIAKVGPEAIPLTDPLAGVLGAQNAITYDCDLAGPITLIGAGAGRKETGFSILIDLININRDQL
ncbi:MULTISPECIES: homoserine dehydrogenase [unclassified Bacillus (in: firmicutes)]|uniref:homoserine dehydrogenase n=1 Tax=unclassified Bacillus (in: firmicutes) TaxID=185979 RepID=UPI001BEB5626|nr:MULTISPECIES: homoserine dehydrogenase [unclassified Bacillus (in: firmicutes)]MBT2618626.1 homoserine dehydrogenase [Bacillus sp. ISL-78]MBT2628922.1 homoserine dehydrogenase [Bacillus sp. ISL-101]